MNSTQLLLLGLLVWFAMSNKSKDTRNVLLVVAGILFFCMMNVKEGFTIADFSGTGSGSAKTVAVDGGKIFTFTPDTGGVTLSNADLLTIPNPAPPRPPIEWCHL